MNLHKSMAITFLLLGIVSLLLGTSFVIIALGLGSVASQSAMMPGGAEIASGLQMMTTIMWIFGILEILLGISSLVSSALLLKKKDEKKGKR